LKKSNPVDKSITFSSFTTLDRTNSVINYMAQEQITKVEAPFVFNLILNNKENKYDTVFASPHSKIPMGFEDTLLDPFNKLEKLFFKKDLTYNEKMDTFTDLLGTKYLLPEDTEKGWQG